jgi:hypothetical protein
MSEVAHSQSGDAGKVADNTRRIKTDLVINPMATKALSLTIPTTLLGRADKVIE